LELVNCENRWGEWRVFYRRNDGQLGYLPASWTDSGPADPFVALSHGRAIARPEDLDLLAKMIGRGVKENAPAA
jgi:hypothetical protein